MPGTSFSAANWSGYDEQSLSNPASALTDFTLEIDIANLSASWTAAVQSDGGDIRLTKGDNTELPFDLVNWAYNAGSPTGTLFVKYSATMATSGTQNVRVWAGYTPGTAVAYDASETYGQHNTYDADTGMFCPYGKAGNALDRTANGNNGTVSGAVNTSSGYLFDGVNDYIDHGNDASLDVWAGGGTISCVIDADNGGESDQGRICTKSNGTGFFAIPVGNTSAGATQLLLSQARTSTNSQWNAGSTVTSREITLNTPQRVDVTYDESSTANNPIFYRNGSAISGPYEQSTPSGSVTSNTSGDLIVGNRADTARTFDGHIDDFKLSTTIRSAAWIAQEYALRNQATFWGTWAWTANATNHAIEIADAVHLHTADELTITAASPVAIAGAVHLHAADELTIASVSPVAIADAAHLHTADGVSLTSTSPIAIADATHLHTADTVTVAATIAIGIADAVHLHTADTVTLAAGAIAIEIAGAVHLHTAGSVALTASSPIAIADAVHLHSAAGVQISANIDLAVADAAHLHTAGDVAITCTSIIGIADAVHLHTAAGVELAVGLAIEIASAYHLHLADTVTLSGAAFRACLATAARANIDLALSHAANMDLTTSAAANIKLTISHQTCEACHD